MYVCNVCMFCMYVCMYACMYVMYVYLFLCSGAHMHLCMCTYARSMVMLWNVWCCDAMWCNVMQWGHACMYVCMECMYVRHVMHACMQCMYVSMHACMCACIVCMCECMFVGV